ncbi:hypothetical protein KJ934_00380 [Patescibacteria group bacterium]|nr:hypothetical protein [Patescibacteria group bacterium]MBU4353192.1 hypothetical protein [Patescibacteria group bacterium]MBU4477089.1 hypothetical protein [Patescibacteria group bacterium]MCG2698982.1 hypothetical protein [Candidatus Parcubacteria bacterium]
MGAEAIRKEEVSPERRCLWCFGDRGYIEDSEMIYAICLSCARKEGQKRREKFLESMNEEQKKLFKEYEEIDDYITSYIILD